VTSKSSIRSGGVLYKSGVYVRKKTRLTPGDLGNVPQGTELGAIPLNGSEESAEGKVGGLSGEAREALQGRKAQGTDRPRRKATAEGPNDSQGQYGRGRVGLQRQKSDLRVALSEGRKSHWETGLEHSVDDGSATAVRHRLNLANRRIRDPYVRWCDRESPRGHTYVDVCRA
jgi:hypothetical protein